MLAPSRRRLGAGVGRLLQRRDPRRPSTSSSTRWARRRSSSTATSRLSQSGVILDYLAAPLHRLRPRNPRRSAARSCAGRSGTTTSSPSYIASLRFLMKFVPEEKTDQGVIAWLDRARATRSSVLDRHLFSNEWVAADHITIADLSCAGLPLLRPRVRPRPDRLSRTSSAGASRSPPCPAGSIPTT